MRWTIWGTVVALCILGTGQAEAGDGYSVACPSYGCCPPSTYGPHIYGDACHGYYDTCDDQCCFERFWRGMWDLEKRKNKWLLKTFLGIGKNDCCEYPVVPDGGCGAYYPGGYVAPYSHGAYYGHGY